jgi:hypothetical protein
MWLSISCILLFLFSSGGGSPQSIVTLGANPLPANQALVVVEQSQTILLYLRNQPSSFSRETQVPLPAHESLGIFNTRCTPALGDEN